VRGDAAAPMEFLSHERPFELATAPGVRLHAWRYDVAAAARDGSRLPASLAAAAPQRRGEFLAGRHCAVRALAALGATPRDIPIGARREPRFPDGTVGSIAHTATWAVAAAASSRQWRALGVDCEGAIDAAVRADIATLVATPAELAVARAAVADPGLALALVFSMKESAYKALSPALRGAIPDFLDARAVAIDGDRFELVLHGAMREALDAPRLAGQWSRLDARTMLTLVALPVAAAERAA
jgi:enterobactin synthetase component D